MPGRGMRTSVSLAIALAIGAVSAQYGGPPPASEDSDAGGFPGFGLPDGLFPGGGPPADGGDPGVSPHPASVHGILAALAVVVLFPSGAVMLRLVPGRLAVWIHAAAQVAGLVIYAAAVALGVQLAQQMRTPFPGGSFISTNHHPVLGLVVLAALLLQPFLGLLHHVRFKRLRRRSAWTYLHLWIGRIAVCLGIINGGLGLGLTGAPRGQKIAYGIAAAFMWLLWAVVSLMGEARRARREEGAKRRRVLMEDMPVGMDEDVELRDVKRESVVEERGLIE